MSASELTAASDGTDGGSIDGGAGTSDPGDGGPDAGSAGGPAGSDAASDGTAAHSKDVIFDILKNERRRQALHYLREEPTTTLSDLSEHVAALENDKPIRELTSSERKRVYVGLYQCHLPKMADAGVLDYDRSRGSIELCDQTSPYFVYLDIDPTGGPDDGDGPDGRLGRWLTATSSLLRPSTASFLRSR